MGIFDYQASIEITFDKAIETDPAIVTGTEYYKIMLPYDVAWTLLSSGDNASYPKSYAFNSSITDYWQSSLTTAPQYIGKDFGSSVALTKVGVQMDYSSGRINAYEIQGSDNGVDWVTIASGNFTNASGEQAVTFVETTYRYWRLYATSKFSSYYTVSELRFYGTRNTYNTSAWTVTGQEYNRTPDGQAVAETFTVQKVTKSPDGLTVKLWLNMSDRMEAPIGDVTVAYNKDLGNLSGEFDAEVASFSQVFTPHDIVPMYLQPNAKEQLTSQGNMTVSVMAVTYKYIPAESDTFLVPDQDNSYMDENISAQANMTVAVTKVGDLPL